MKIPKFTFCKQTKKKNTNKNTNNISQQRPNAIASTLDLLLLGNLLTLDGCPFVLLINFVKHWGFRQPFKNVFFGSVII